MRPVDRLAGLQALDPVARRLSALADRFPVAVRDVLHGVWLGHPLHPAVAQLPVGAWVSAGILDLVAVRLPRGRDRRGVERAATVLVATGLAASPGAAVPGFVDWSRLHPDQQRVGLVHAAANALAAGCMAASWSARRAGRPGRGRVWAAGGLTLASAGAALGGHLAYRFAAGADHAEDVPHTTPGEWVEVARLDTLAPGSPRQARVGDTPVVVVRQGDRVSVLADRCSHLSGPLSQGHLVAGRDGAPCLVCPWHGSTFEVETGRVVHGPATSAQPVFRTRTVDGVVSAQVLPAAAAGSRTTVRPG